MKPEAFRSPLAQVTSHLTRLVQRRMQIDGDVKTVDQVLANPRLAPLLSNEGVMHQSRYE